MATFLTQLWADQHVQPISRDPVSIESLIARLPASGTTGELRIIDESPGAVITRFPLNQEPDEGDWHQPFPAA